MKRERVKAIDFKAGKPTRWQAYDVFAFDVGDASKRKMVPGTNFMIVPAFISCTGIQDYTARELGLEGTNRTIRLLRPAEEVFKPESYSTFERQTLTNSHPDGDVTATNYRQVTSGDVHDVAPAADGVNLGANLYVKDASTIEMVVTYDKNQLSCGYSFVLDMTPGTTPEGENYDGVMRDIVGNHVAIVWQARGGPGLRVADKKPNQERKTMRTVIIDGTNVNFEDDNQGAMVELALKRAADAVKVATDAATAARAEATAAATALAAATAASTEAKAAHDAKVAELTAKVVLTPEQEEARSRSGTKVIGDAKAIVGDKFDAKGKTIGAIRVEALTHVLAKDAARRSRPSRRSSAASSRRRRPTRSRRSRSTPRSRCWRTAPTRTRRRRARTTRRPAPSRRARTARPAPAAAPG
jgi:hypothetical protein